MPQTALTCAKCGNALPIVTPGTWACPSCGWQFVVSSKPHTVTVPKAQLLVPTESVTPTVDVNVKLSVAKKPTTFVFGISGWSIASYFIGAAVLMLLSYTLYRYEFARVGDELTATIDDTLGWTPVDGSFANEAATAARRLYGQRRLFLSDDMRVHRSTSDPNLIRIDAAQSTKPGGDKAQPVKIFLRASLWNGNWRCQEVSNDKRSKKS